MRTSRQEIWVFIEKHKTLLGIFILYLFHVSAMIGISLGYQDWFVEKTPFNLSLVLILTIWLYAVNNRQAVIGSVIFFLLGFFVEWLGVNYGFLFGDYAYGANLGYKLGGVPLLIGVNWSVLVLVTGALADRVKSPLWVRVIFGAGLMLFLDFFMEMSAPIFDFWRFAGEHAPLSNYTGWFLVAVILHFIFQKMKIKGSFDFSLHVYFSQLLFFGYFYFYFLLS